jgi:Ca2+-binding RTX toxin-like protein
VGGHWQTATDSNAPINQGTYNATIIANKGANILDPQTAPIWTVNTSVGAGTASIEGNIFVDTNNSNVQDQGLYTAGEVIVTILDCDANIVNIMTTKTTGAYKFTGLYAGTYYIQFSLPAGQQFVTPNFGADDTIDSDAEIAGATKSFTLIAGQALKDVDAGLEDLGTLPVSSSSTVAFAQAEWHVSENDPSHKVVITLVRSNASEAEAIVWFASNGTAVSPTNYIGSQGIVIFQPGETLATFEIQIVPAGIVGCTVKDFHLSIRRPTGQPIRGGEASVYIHGGAAPTNSDNDTILAGEDWDTALGDSGHINSNAVQAASANGQIQDTGGLGHDTMYGNDGPDYLNGQLGNDVIAGGEGNDFVYAGYGNDRIIAELDDDELHGDHGTDRVAGTSPLPYITLDGSGVPGRLTFGKAPIPDLPTLPDPADYVFLLFDIESAELFGTPGNDVFLMKSWNAEAWVFGDDGGDIFHVTNDLPLVSVSTASAAQKFLYKFLFGFDVNANVVLSSGPAYHFGQMEIVWLTGGASANTIDASAYTMPVILEGLAGDDTLIGGSSSDVFRFNTDSPLGTDTLTGNGGIDLLDFSAGLNLGINADLANFSTQVVNANLSLVITAEDLEGIFGGPKNDDLKGNGLNNILIGGAGDDTLTGRGGNEIYSYDTDTAWGSDTIVETSADIGHDIIDFSATTLQVIKLNLGLVGPQVVTPGNLTLTISGNGIDEVIGGAKNDEIVGNSVANTLRGGLGDDSLYGAAGDDFLDGGPGTDILDGGPDIDSIAAIANSNFTLTDSQLLRNGTDVDILYSIDNADLTGGASNNVFNLTGWSGNATINGMGGIDTIIFEVDADMTLSTAGSNDVLDIGGGASQFTVSNIERWTLSGGVSDNIILANTYTRAGG